MDSRRRLLSSPSRSSMQAEALVILSSSPDFPSISDLLPKRERKPLLRSGSRAAPIPETAFGSFTTASHFWHSSIASGAEDGIAGASTTAKALQNDERLDFERACLAIDDAPSCSKPAQTGAPPGDKSITPVFSEPTVRQIPAGVRPQLEQTRKPLPAAEAMGDLELSSKEKPWKKYKEKDAAGGQTKIAKGKVTKASASNMKQPKKKTETVSRHFATPVGPAPIELLDDPIDLEPALTRRTDWTPTKNTEPSLLLLNTAAAMRVTSPGPADTESSLPLRTDIFKNLRDTYSCTELKDVSQAVRSFGEPTDVLGKRKLIEMVTTCETARSTTPSASPIKRKAPKKKPRTITELATAAYRVVDIADDLGNEELPKDRSLLSYFTPNEESEPAQPGEDTAVPANAKGFKAKAKPKRASKKKADLPKPVLLSPESAMRQVSRQDFVFGTSSQLATEVDAGLLRDLQQAMRDSNRQDNSTSSETSLVTSNAAPKSARKTLWSAGARDEKGDLLEVEVIDLVNSPAIEEDLTNPDVILSLATGRPEGRAEDRVDSRSGVQSNNVDVIALSSSPIPAQHTKPHFRLASPQKRAMSGSAATKPSALDQATMLPVVQGENPPASNQEQHHQMASSAPLLAAPEPPEVLAPRYDLYTDAQLAKEVQSYGFKPIKKRTAVIALLQQCWTSKHQLKSQTMGHGPTASLSTSSTAAAKAKTTTSELPAPKLQGRPKKAASVADLSWTAPSAGKRPRGRPKEEAACSDSIVSQTTVSTRFATLPQSEPHAQPIPTPSTPKRKRRAPSQRIVEIADSDDSDTNPFASSRSSSSATNSPTPGDEFSSPEPGVELSMTTVADENSVLSLTSSPTGQQSHLFRYITNAVKTAPRSRDPQKPSWHEKMLMYDPIVIEDLTAWLNGGELDRVGCEEEVGTGDVKKWCESKSVCCLWRVNINGKERKRF